MLQVLPSPRLLLLRPTHGSKAADADAYAENRLTYALYLKVGYIWFSLTLPLSDPCLNMT